jgi:protein-L-isoaspartate(D-aspartate) O-methyltransferase
MTDLLNLSPENIVLEIGTGCGYQAAILSRLVKKVYSIELIPELHKQTASRLKKLKYNNIETRVGDGYAGWPENGPYDGIIVTAAAAYVPEALIEQLKRGGNMVIPVGPPYGHQELMLIEKDMNGEIKLNDVLGVAFVPLVNTGLDDKKMRSH